MKGFIKQLLRENLLSEEFNNGILYGHHVTSINNWEDIKTNGLVVGSRAMQGKGLYAFYDYDHAVRYAMKGEVTNPIIIKFEITNPRRFIILNMDIAKEIFGAEEYHLENQIEQYFYGGFDTFYEEVSKANPNMSIDDLKKVLIEIETNNTEMKQKTFVFELIPSTLNDELNIIWNGNYGLEYRINRINLIKVLGYQNLKDKSEVNISIFDKIPDTEEFKPLIELINQGGRYDTLDKLRDYIYNISMSTRNSREYDYCEELLKLIDKIK
jgi:hypothetical protein